MGNHPRENDRSGSGVVTRSRVLMKYCYASVQPTPNSSAARARRLSRVHRRAELSFVAARINRSFHSNPRPKRARFSSKFRISGKLASVAKGSASKYWRIVRRFFILPTITSPSTHGQEMTRSCLISRLRFAQEIDPHVRVHEHFNILVIHRNHSRWKSSSHFHQNRLFTPHTS